MSYWKETRDLAASTLGSWRALPVHAKEIKKHLAAAIRSVGHAAGRLVAFLIMLILPLFFWLAPVFVPWARSLRAKEERARREAIERLTSGQSRLRRVVKRPRDDTAQTEPADKGAC